MTSSSALPCGLQAQAAMIDACKPHRHLEHFPPPTLLTQSTYRRVVERWAEFGFVGRPPRPATFHPE